MKKKYSPPEIRRHKVLCTSILEFSGPGSESEFGSGAAKDNSMDDLGDFSMDLPDNTLLSPPDVE